MDERSKKFLEASPIMQEIHEKAQRDDCECLHVTEIAKKTGLKYIDGGKIVPCGGYFPQTRKSAKRLGIKECLIRWRWIDDDITEIRREMRVWKSRFEDPAITSYTERMRSKGLPSGIDRILEKRDHLEGLFMEELEFLLEVRARINEFMGVVDEVDREIFTYRYFHGYDWYRVAELTGREHNKMCSDTNRILERWDHEGTYKKVRRYKKRTK